MQMIETFVSFVYYYNSKFVRRAQIFRKLKSRIRKFISPSLS
jgi:hypothetical protein